MQGVACDMCQKFGCDVRMGAWCFWCVFLVCAWFVHPYKVRDNVYVQKAEKKIVFANFYFRQRSCQLLFLAEFCQRRFSLPKILNHEFPRANCQKWFWLPKKDWHFGCQKKCLAQSLLKIKIGMIVPDRLFHFLHRHHTCKEYSLQNQCHYHRCCCLFCRCLPAWKPLPGALPPRLRRRRQGMSVQRHLTKRLRDPGSDRVFYAPPSQPWHVLGGGDDDNAVWVARGLSSSENGSIVASTMRWSSA